MQELRIVAVSEDGSYAVLAVPGRGGRFSLPIDDRLRIVARGQFSRLAQYEIEVESPLRPKEIQDRIRAGETAEDIADAAGVPIERVRRFEGPVLAERAYRAQEAQSATIRRPGDSGPGPRLGDIVAERLTLLGIDPEEVAWDSRKLGDSTWHVQLVFAVGGRPHRAEWSFDPRRRHVSPASEEAARLSLPEADLSPLLPSRPEPRATVTQIASRLSHPTSQAPTPAASPSLAPPGPAGTVPPSPAQGTAVAPRPGPAPSPAPVHAPAPAAAPAAAHPPVPAPAAARGGEAQPPVGAPRPAEPPAAALDREATAEPDRETAAAAAGGDGPQQPAPQPRGRGGRKAAGGRSRRSSVPSWDEIMFGTSRQPD